MATEIDRMIVRLDADITRMEAKLNRAIEVNRAAKKKIEDGWKTTAPGAALNDLFKSASALASEIPVLGAAIESLGPAGVVAAVGIGTLIAALEAAKKAAEFGDEIYKAAQAAGVSTTALQLWRQALEEAGGSAAAAGPAIANFSAQLGQAALGAPKALKAFQALKLDPKAMVGDLNAALTETLDKLSRIGPEAERAGLAKKLGLEEMLPLARKTAEQLDELKTSALASGAVMGSDYVEAAHKAAVAFAELSKVTKVQLEESLLDLAEPMLKVARWVADMATGIHNLTTDIKTIATLFQVWGFSIGDAVKEMVHLQVELSPVIWQMRQISDALDKMASASREQALKRVVADVAAGGKGANAPNIYGTTSAAMPTAAKTTDLGSLGKPPPADEFKVKQTEIQKQIETAEKQFEQAWLAATIGVEARAEHQRTIAEIEYQIQQTEIATEREKLANNKTITKAERATLDKELDALGLQQKNNHEMALEAIDREKAATIRQQDLAQLETIIGIRADEVKAQKALARTAAERQRLELEALALADARVVAEQQAIIEANKTDPSSKAAADARARIAAVQASQPERQQAVVNANLGPFADWLNKLPQNLQEVNEGMQAVASQGLQGMIDGLAGAATGTQKLGDVFKTTIIQMIADLAKLQLESGFAKVLRSLSGNPLPYAPPMDDLAGLYADGTSSSASGWSMVGERGPELVKLPAGSQVIPNSALRNVGIGSQATAPPTIIFDNRGAVIWEQAARQMMSYADRVAAMSGSMAVQASRRATPVDLATQGARRLA
jgi:hypothetical protein